MPAWKVLFIMLMAAICFTLGTATIVVPISMREDETRWYWAGGLFAGTVVMGTLFTLFLRSQDRKTKW